MRRTRIQNTRKHSFIQTIKLGLTGLLFCIPFVTSHAQEASYHDHNIYHGAGDAYVNTSAQAQQVGEGGVLRAQLIWNVTPNQTVGADLDLHAKLPDGNGQYLVTQFDPVGALPYTPQKNPPFGNPNTSATGNQQVNWVNRQVAFNPSQNPQTLGQPLSIASLDQDNRTGAPNSPAGALVENIYIKGTSPASPDNIPSGTYQFAVHNYNQTKLSDPQADYALWITTNGKVGIRSDGHYTGTGQAPVYTGHLQNEGDSSRIYSIDIVNPGHDPHAAGVYVIDGKRAYVNAWKAEQARIAEYRRQQALLAQPQIERSRAAQMVERIDWGNCRPPKICQTSLYPTSKTLEYVIDPNRAREKLVQSIAPAYKAKTVNADVYQQNLPKAPIVSFAEGKWREGFSEVWRRQTSGDPQYAFGTHLSQSFYIAKETTIGTVQGLYGMGKGLLSGMRKGVTNTYNYYSKGQLGTDIYDLTHEPLPEAKYIIATIKDDVKAIPSSIKQGVYTYTSLVNQGKYREAASYATPTAVGVVGGGLTLKSVFSKSQTPRFYGEEKPWTTGATPNSVYSHVKEGKVIQNAIYDANGDVIGHVDFKNHGIESGHWHQFPTPGDPSSGHGVGFDHFPNSSVPNGWDKLPKGFDPTEPVGE